MYLSRWKIQLCMYIPLWINVPAAILCHIAQYNAPSLLNSIAIIILGDFYLLLRFAVFSKKEEELAFVLTESLSFTMDTEADKSR